MSHIARTAMNDASKNLLSEEDDRATPVPLQYTSAGSVAAERRRELMFGLGALIVGISGAPLIWMAAKSLQTWFVLAAGSSLAMTLMLFARPNWKQSKLGEVGFALTAIWAPALFLWSLVLNYYGWDPLRYGP